MTQFCFWPRDYKRNFLQWCVRGAHLAPPLCTLNPAAYLPSFQVTCAHVRWFRQTKNKRRLNWWRRFTETKGSLALHSQRGRKTPRWVDSWCGMCGCRSLATHYFACERQRFAASASKLRPRPFHARASSAMLLFAAPREIQFGERTLLQRSAAPTEHGHGVRSMRCGSFKIRNKVAAFPDYMIIQLSYFLTFHF